MQGENMLCVVKALDIMPWWGVVGAPDHFGDDLDAAWGKIVSQDTCTHGSSCGVGRGHPCEDSALADCPSCCRGSRCS